MTLGAELKKARNLKGLSQEDVALKLEVSQKTYANYEQEKTSPSIQLLPF